MTSLARISLETLREVSVLLGRPLCQPSHPWEPGGLHDPSMLPARFREPDAHAGWPTLAPDRTRCFYYGSVDLLPVREDDGGVGYQILELNGTGVGGLARLPAPLLGGVLGELWELPRELRSERPLVLCTIATSATRTVGERVLIAQALKEGLAASRGRGEIVVLGDEDRLPADRPLVVLTRYARRGLRVVDGELRLFDRRVDAIVRDLHCQHVLDCFPGELDPSSFFGINRIFPICASKARTYAAYNSFLAADPALAAARRRLLRRPVRFEVAADRAELHPAVQRLLDRGRSAVIKPHAAGSGRGIAFVHPADSAAFVHAELERAIADAPRVSGRVFPYTVCELLDCPTIERAGHPLLGHRYELRILVFRIGMTVRAFPTVCRVSGWRYDSEWTDRRMLLNTMTRSLESRADGACALPLCHPATLDAIGLTPDTLAELCDAAAAFVHAVVSGAEEGRVA
jgi:hypothetical protein